MSDLQIGDTVAYHAPTDTKSQIGTISEIRESEFCTIEPIVYMVRVEEVIGYMAKSLVSVPFRRAEIRKTHSTNDMDDQIETMEVL